MKQNDRWTRIGRRVRRYRSSLALALIATLDLLFGCATPLPQPVPVQCPQQVVVPVPQPQGLKAIAALDTLLTQCNKPSQPAVVTP